MPRSLFCPEFDKVLNTASVRAFPSPRDWRDYWIYFLMVDRFNNPTAPPRHMPYNDPAFFGHQGGTFSGVRQALPYLKRLGAGVLWLSPVLKNLPFDDSTYHGYGIHDFLHAEPRFADDPERADDELREMVDAAHTMGIYVILDIVLNHTGNVFSYACNMAGEDGSEVSFKPETQPVRWRDASGTPRYGSVEHIPDPPRNALVWPMELQQDRFFRRQGSPAPHGDDTVGDFGPLKQMMTADPDLQRYLTRVFQYVIARFDPDGFRIDTLRYLKGDLASRFTSSMREFASTIGKKNFFMFGSRYTNSPGLDAVYDYGLFDSFRWVLKGMAPPATLARVFGGRAQPEATRAFVTFLDNHDVKDRIRWVAPDDERRFDDQVTLAMACLFSLPGIPCLYYGTEQGLHGSGSDPGVREALWGAPGLDESNWFYRETAKIAAVRRRERALRYGSLFLRPVSGDGCDFGISPFLQGIIAFSRILEDDEIVTVANTSVSRRVSVDVVVDALLNLPGTQYRVVYSNNADPVAPNPIQRRKPGSVMVREVDGSTGTGPVHCVRVSLRPLEVQILRA